MLSACALICCAACLPAVIHASDFADGQDEFFAQPQYEENASTKLLDATKGEFRFEPSFYYGFGLRHNYIGTIPLYDVQGHLVETRDVNINPGSGFGGTLGIAYGLSRRLESDLTLGYQWTTVNSDLGAISGNFPKTFSLVTLKYKIPTGPKQIVKIGAGGGIYYPQTMELRVFDDSVNLEYKQATGYHISVDMENHFGKSYTMLVGLRYTAVSFQLDKYEYNGQAYPKESVPDCYRPVDASSIDLILTLRF
jgi:hypothetical protein